MASDVDGDRLLAIADHVIKKIKKPAQRFRWTRSVAAAARKQMQSARRAPQQLMLQAAEKAQKEYFNHHHACRKDFEFKTRENNAPKYNSKGQGSGRYKQRTPQEVLRILETPPCRILKSVAGSLRPAGSVRHCTDLLFACCDMIMEAQHLAVEATLASAAGFVVLQLTFDETTFHLLTTGSFRRLAADESLLAIHGRLLWSTSPDLNVHEDEVVLHPGTMDSYSAATLF